MSDWKRYRRTAIAEMRPYVRGDSLRSKVSVSAADAPTVWSIDAGNPPSGFVARNPKNHSDKWYVAQAYAEANFDLENPVADDA